jgi:hypothetical protein
MIIRSLLEILLAVGCRFVMPDPFQGCREQHEYQDDQPHATRYLQITRLID